MKKMLSKIALAALVLSSIPIHASLGQYIQNGVGKALQSIGNNAWPITKTMAALSAILVLKRAYDLCVNCDKIIKNSADQKVILRNKDDKKSIFRITPVAIAIASSLTAFSSYGLSKVCGWVGSHIEIVPMPSDVSLGQTMQNTTRTVLQGLGDNSGWLAFAALLPFVYTYAREKKDSKDVTSKDIIKEMAKVVVPVAGLSYGLSKAFSWAGSKI